MNRENGKLSSTNAFDGTRLSNCEMNLSSAYPLFSTLESERARGIYVFFSVRYPATSLLSQGLLIQPSTSECAGYCECFSLN